MLIPNIRFYIETAVETSLSLLPNATPNEMEEGVTQYLGTLTRVSRHAYRDKRQMEEDFRGSHRLMINVDYDDPTPAGPGDRIHVVEELWPGNIWRDVDKSFRIVSITHEPGLGFAEANVTEEP